MSEDRVLTIAEALREGIVEEMERDERVFCIGEDIGIPGGWGGAFTVTLNLEQKFPERTINTPISEAALFGAALGASVMGLIPIADVQYGDFLFCAMDQIVSQISMMRYMSGGKVNTPIVMRAPVGASNRGAQHAHSMEPWITCVPGIKVICPSNAYDAKGMFKSAVRDGNPVMIFEHKLLYGSKGARAEKGTMDASRFIPREDYTVPIGKAAVVKEGSDVSIFSTLLMLHRSLGGCGTARKGRGILRGRRFAYARAARQGDGACIRAEDRPRGGRGGEPQDRRLGRRGRRGDRGGDVRVPGRTHQTGVRARYACPVLAGDGELLRAVDGKDQRRGCRDLQLLTGKDREG